MSLKIVALGSLLIGFVACTHSVPKKEDLAVQQQLKFLIGDGNVRIEEKVAPSTVDRKTAQYFVDQVDTARFKEVEIELPGKTWVEESSEYLLSGSATEKKCEIKISQWRKKKAPASVSGPSYLIKVTVKDGMKDSPFESIINGENEGEILIGQYPVSSFQSTEEIVVNETVIPYWVYNPKSGTYEIVKKMGERRFLHKVLTFDPHLKSVKKVKYEILSDIGGQVYDQMSVLARFQCGA